MLRTQNGRCVIGLVLALAAASSVALQGQEKPLENSPTKTPPQSAPSPKSDAPAKTLTLDWGGGVTMELVRIEAGEFLMGSPKSEEGRYEQEGPQHRVKISKPFYIGKYEVTQKQWQAVMNNNPSAHKGDDRPVEKISWYECEEFCKRLSQKVGQAVRLPTEAEWEYACRAGTTTRFSFGDSDAVLGEYAWFDEKRGGNTHPVGQKKPNAWGLYDMHGNVWELCQDWHAWDSYENRPNPDTDPTGPGTGIARVHRGGSWLNGPRLCRSAFRGGPLPEFRSLDGGLRIVVVGIP